MIIKNFVLITVNYCLLRSDVKKLIAFLKS